MTALVLELADLSRICRDLAWSDISAMPGQASALGPRLSPGGIDWSGDGLALDSLSRMQLATAAATWCNAYDAGFEDLFLAKRCSADWAVLMDRSRSAGARHFTFASSGSSGVRKHIRHREDVLASEANVWATLLNEGKPADAHIKRVVVLAPTHHIYGFIWGVLLPLALGVPALDADIDHLPPLLPGDLVVAVPDQWRWLAGATSNPSPRHWPGNLTGVSSTSPLPDAIHRKLISVDPVSQTMPPMARLWQIYGSSETAGLGWRADPAHPYTLAPGRTRTPGDGIELLLPSGATAAMAVQDELHWVDAKSFHLVRRHDQSVQVGGHNVSPAWVTDQLLGHPSVRQAAVRLSTSARPPRLKAFVVLHAPGDADQRRTLEDWALNQLPWYANFSSVAYGSELPINAMGKLSDWPDPI
jgi:long-chain acyl-CoA synthetase